MAFFDDLKRNAKTAADATVKKTNELTAIKLLDMKINKVFLTPSQKGYMTIIHYFQDSVKSEMGFFMNNHLI